MDNINDIIKALPKLNKYNVGYCVRFPIMNHKTIAIENDTNLWELNTDCSPFDPLIGYIDFEVKLINNKKQWTQV